MFRLPICPYCHTVYRYGDVRKNKNKEIQCYHCKKTFKESKKSYLILGLIVAVIAILINIAMIAVYQDIFKSIVPMFIVSIISVVIGLLLTPFFIKYKISE